MSTISGKLVVGIFEDHERVEQALAALRQAGFLDTEVGVIAPHNSAQSHTSGEHTSEIDDEKTVKDASVGALLGASFGGAGVLALATLMIPPVGPVFLGGFLTMLAVGGTSGALAGGIVGGLMGMGMPERHAREIEEALLAGCTILKVRTETRQAEAAEVLDRCGAQHIGTPSPEATEVTGDVHQAHLDMRPEHLIERGPSMSAGGFTATGGFAELAKVHDGTRHFHLPGAKPDAAE